jgi:phenylacetate-CoA ligase
VEALLGEFTGLSPLFRVVVTPRDALLEVRLEVESGAVDGTALAGALRERLLGGCPCLGVDAAKNAIQSVIVEIVKPGGIERVERTGKIRRVVDRRLG